MKTYPKPTKKNAGWFWFRWRLDDGGLTPWQCGSFETEILGELRAEIMGGYTGTVKTMERKGVVWGPKIKKPTDE